MANNNAAPRYERVLLSLGILLTFLAVAVFGYMVWIIQADDSEAIGSSVASSEKKQTVNAAIVRILGPSSLFPGYVELFDYLSHKANVRMNVLQQTKCGEIAELLQTKRVELTFSSLRAYINARRTGDAEILAVPEINGSAEECFYVFVRSSSQISSFEDLRGKRFAFSNPYSFGGHVYPEYIIGKRGERSSSFFAKCMYTGSEDKSIDALQRGLVDGAASNGSAFEYFLRYEPDKVRGLRVIQKSPCVGQLPMVVHPDTDAKVKRRLRQVLLGMHRDSEGKRILARLGFDRFIAGDPDRYQFAEELYDFAKALEKAK